MKKITTLALLITLISLSSCGIKGALDLPQDDEEQSSSLPSNSY